jgi:hypothetical protein
LAADDSMRLSVLAARTGVLVINIVLTAVISASAQVDFIFIFSFGYWLLVFNT